MYPQDAPKEKNRRLYRNTGHRPASNSPPGSSELTVLPHWRHVSAKNICPRVSNECIKKSALPYIQVRKKADRSPQSFCIRQQSLPICPNARRNSTFEASKRTCHVLATRAIVGRTRHQLILGRHLQSIMSARVNSVSYSPHNSASYERRRAPNCS